MNPGARLHPVTLDGKPAISSGSATRVTPHLTGMVLPFWSTQWTANTFLARSIPTFHTSETYLFARMVDLNLKMRSPVSNGIAERFVKTMVRGYISIMSKPDGVTTTKNLVEAFVHYSEWHIACWIIAWDGNTYGCVPVIVKWSQQSGSMGSNQAGLHKLRTENKIGQPIKLRCWSLFIYKEICSMTSKACNS